jgi:hypothetical protein
VCVGGTHGIINVLFKLFFVYFIAKREDMNYRNLLVILFLPDLGDYPKIKFVIQLNKEMWPYCVLIIVLNLFVILYINYIVVISGLVWVSCWTTTCSTVAHRNAIPSATSRYVPVKTSSVKWSRSTDSSDVTSYSSILYL